MPVNLMQLQWDWYYGLSFCTNIVEIKPHLHIYIPPSFLSLVLLPPSECIIVKITVHFKPKAAVSSNTCKNHLVV